MKRSLKRKFMNLFLILVIINILIGAFSIFNLLKIGKASDKVLNENYDSITFCDKMLDIIDLMDKDIISYIIYEDNTYLKDFYEKNSEFTEPLYFQLNNVTEHYEDNSTANIKKNYEDFLTSFSSLIKSSANNKELLLKNYTAEVKPSYLKLRKSIRDVALLNQKAMLTKKENVTYKIHTSTFSMIFLSIGLILTSLFLAFKLISKFLNPVYSLQNDILKAKEGDFSHKATIISEDEIGMLASEFNDMSNKISEFQNSTLGQLLNEKNKSLAIVKSIADPLIVLDINCRVLLLNDACQEFFNIDQQKVIGHHILEAIPNGELYDFISELLNNNLDTSSKIINFKDDEFIYNVNLSVIMDNKSNLNGIIVSFQNITHIKNLEKIKNNFVSSISHEIKTPLTSIMMGASLLEEVSEIKTNENIAHIISTINEDSQKLLTLINNFLRISQIASDDSLLNKDVFDIKSLIEESVLEFNSLASTKEISIILDSHLNECNYYGDEDKIGWVINNLLSNAIKFSNNNSSIYVTIKETSTSIEFSVKDEGIGISHENIPKVFCKFFRANENIDGTGLGLSLSKQIIDIHNGVITCDSTLNKGTTFTVILQKNI